MIIDSSGQVGIGTTAPAGELDIVTSSTSGTKIRLENTSTGGGVWQVISTGSGNTGGANTFQILDDSTNRLVIKDGGNVGIGTTDPAAELNVNGDILLKNGGEIYSEQDLVIENRGVSGDLLFKSDRHMLFQDESDDSEYMRIEDGGNVGIGTTEPSVPLHVYHATLNNVLRLESGDAYVGVEFVDSNTTGNRPQINAVTDDLYFQTGGEQRLYIKDTGLVGIGTTAPATILDVVQGSATDPIADAWDTHSSRRWKDNIQPLKGCLAKVQALRGVSFDWKKTGERDIGLIAEEVGKVIPEVVNYEENGIDAKSLDYARLVAVLIEAVKDQQEEIEYLKERLDKIESDS